MTTNQIAYMNAMEKFRNDKAIEVETNRHNQAIEAYNSGLLSNQEFANKEVKRHNQVMEKLQNRANEIQSYRAQIDARYNELTYELGQRRQAEVERADLAQELLTRTRNEVDANIRQTQARIEERRLEYQHQENLLVQQETARHNRETEYTQRLATTGKLVTDSVQAGANMSAKLLPLLLGVG